MNLNKLGKKYIMKNKKDKDIYLQASTTIDPATEEIEICSAPETRADLVANKVEMAQSITYPLPEKITIDRIKKLLAKFKSMMANDYRFSYQ